MPSSVLHRIISFFNATGAFIIILLLGIETGICRTDFLEEDNFDATENITRAIEFLLDKERYDIRLRPGFGENSITVGMDIEIASINSISEVNMDYTLSMYFRQYWRDDRLEYDSKLGNVSLDGRLAERIWLPDTYFPNDKSSFVHDVTVKNRMLRFHFDGSITYGMRITTVASCMMDLRHYPMDTQTCTLEIESYGYTMDDVTYEWAHGKDSIEGIDKVARELAQFTLADYKTTKKVKVFATGAYPRLQFVFVLKRNIGFFLLQTYTPSILIVVLSWVSFYINHEATSARVALGITTVLTMTTISTSLRADLPRISYIKSIDIYVITCFGFVFAALIEYAIANFIFWSGQKRKAKEAKIQTAANAAHTNAAAAIHNATGPARKYRDNTYEKSDIGCECQPPDEVLTCNQTFELQYNQKVAMRLSQLEDEDHETESIPMDNLNGLDRARAARKSATKVRRRGSLTYRHSHPAWFSAGRSREYIPRRRIIRLRAPQIKDVNNIDRFSRVFFPVMFILFNLIYWVCYLIWLPSFVKDDDESTEEST